MFVSYGFIGFLLLLFLLYYIIPKKFQWVLLLCASFLFYFNAGKLYPLFLLFTSAAVYLSGLLINRLDERLSSLKGDERKKQKAGINRKKKGILISCLVINLGVLAVTKYTNFVMESLGTFIPSLNKAEPLDLIVPLGISFYTFQALGYLLDVYWGRCGVQKNFFRFTLFVSFFPQLVQGPISRYKDLGQELYREHPFLWAQVKEGLLRILWGYFKKLVIADRIGAAAAVLFMDPEYYSGFYVFAGMIFWAVQLYADFTGGIDITIGIAKVFGISVKENFIRPFFSKNIAEYWRRWHISMGTWFRDYVFYPLSISRWMRKLTNFVKRHFGANMARRAAVYVSTIIVWLLTGIWHGSAWHFVVWGLANGIILLISEEFKPLYKKFHNRFPSAAQSRAYQGFQLIRTFMLMCFLRMFDTYGNVGTAFWQMKHMFTDFRWEQVSAKEFLQLGISAADYLVVFAGVIIMFLVSMLGRKESVGKKIINKPWAVQYGVFMLLLFSVILFGAYGAGYDSRQFIYNQF